MCIWRWCVSAARSTDFNLFAHFKTTTKPHEKIPVSIFQSGHISPNNEKTTVFYTGKLYGLTYMHVRNVLLYPDEHMSVPSTVRFLEASSVSTTLPGPVLKYDASQMYIPPSLHLAWLMVSEMNFWEMLPSAVPITEPPRVGFPLFWSDPAETTSTLGLLCNTRKMIKLSKVRTPVDGGSHFTVTVPPMDVVLGVRFSCVGVTVILACP